MILSERFKSHRINGLLYLEWNDEMSDNITDQIFGFLNFDEK